MHIDLDLIYIPPLKRQKQSVPWAWTQASYNANTYIKWFESLYYLLSNIGLWTNLPVSEIKWTEALPTFAHLLDLTRPGACLTLSFVFDEKKNGF